MSIRCASASAGRAAEIEEKSLDALEILLEDGRMLRKLLDPRGESRVLNAYGEQGSKTEGAVVTLFVTASNRHDA